MRIPFAVGRLTHEGSRVVLVTRDAPAPVAGPWALRALVRPTPGT